MDVLGTEMFMCPELQESFVALINMLQLRFSQKKTWFTKEKTNYDCTNPQFHLSIGVTGDVHYISRYIHDLHNLHGIYMIFAMLFLHCTCRAHNMAENQTNLAENLKIFISAKPVEPAFLTLHFSKRAILKELTSILHS